MNFLPIEIYIYKKNFLIKQTNFQIEIKQNKLISTFPVTGTCNACFSDNKWGLKSGLNIANSTCRFQKIVKILDS